ncbi:hypothetical protein [Nocardia jinanensis]|nr:hypothetical protein [Nocardia jinanensis]
MLAVAGMAASAGVTRAQEQGQRPLLLILLRPTTNSLIAPFGSLAHDRAWYEDRIFGTTGVTGSRNVVDYYSALSRGRFTFKKAATVEVFDARSPSLLQKVGVDNDGIDDNGKASTADDDSPTTVTRKVTRYLAAEAGFDYSDYDSNGDGTVTTDELTILSIDSLSDGSGQSEQGGDPRGLGCLPLSGVNVCSGVSLAGQMSDLMNYAHELSHLLTPGSIDLYGFNACHSKKLTLLSCTREDPPGTGLPLVSPDEVDGYFMDPWHRAKYGWAGPDRTVALTGTGSEVLVPVNVAAPGIFGTFETLTLTGPNNEAVTFEARVRSASPYEDGLSAEGVLAWYRSINSYSNPAIIPSLLNSRKEDRAHFTLAPVSCILDPDNQASRGVETALGAGTYRLNWSGGTDSGFLIQVTPIFPLYRISWSPSSNAASCAPATPPPPGPPIPPQLQELPELPTLPPPQRFLCGLLPLLCNPCGPFGLCLPPASS